MTTTLEKLKLVAPEFKSEPDDRLESFLSMAADEMSSDALGQHYELAVVNLAAHNLTIAERGKKFQDVPGAPSGGISSADDGDASYSGAVGAGDDPHDRELFATTYGAKVARLKKSADTTPRIIG